MTVIRGSGTRCGEVGAALAVRVQISLPGIDILARDLAEAAQRVLELLVLGIDDRVRAVRGDDAPPPAARADLVMMIERVHRRLGGRQHLDVEALEQRTRAKLVLRQLLADHVEVMIRRLGLQAHRQAEHLGKHVVQPQP